MSTAAERPEWLPEGWKMVVKTSMTGDKDVCYTCPTSSRTFNSKEEIMHYLSHEKVDGYISKPTSCFGDNVHPLAEQIKDFPDWLPAGWVLEFKTRKSGKHAGQQYKCYIDPVTGCRFYSKNQVLRYVNDGMFCNPRAKKKRSVVTKITENAFSSTSQRKGIKRSTTENVRSQIEYTPDGLPSGWIKEVRYRKANSRSGPKRDQYYTDPVNGYVFRSRKDAIQYIETGQLSKYAFKRKNINAGGLHTSKESHPSPAARKIKSRGTAVKRCLFPEGTPAPNVKIVTEINQLPERLSLPLLEHPSAQNMDGTDSSGKTLSNVKELGNSKDAPNDRKLNPGCISGVSSETLESETVDVSEPAINKSPEPLSDTTSEALNKALDELSPTPRKLDLVHENHTEMQDKEADEAADKIPVELEILRPCQQENMSLPALEGKQVEEGKLDLKNGEQMQPNRRRRGRRPGSTRAKALKAITMPRRASKRLAALRADRIASSGAGSHPCGAMSRLSDQLQAHPTATKKSNQQKEIPVIDLEMLEEPESREHPAEQAAPVSQVHLGELEDKPGSPLRLPFGDSWPDPCIEFAFKTLTGDIPVLEDTAAIEEYFHQQLGTSKSPGQQDSASLTIGSHKSFSQGEVCLQLQPPDGQRDDGRPCSFENGLQSSQKGNETVCQTLTGKLFNLR